MLVLVMSLLFIQRSLQLRREGTYSKDLRRLKLENMFHSANLHREEIYTKDQGTLEGMFNSAHLHREGIYTKDQGILEGMSTWFKQAMPVHNPFTRCFIPAGQT